MVAGLKRQEFFTGGSVLEVQATDHAPGDGRHAGARGDLRGGSPAFETGDGFKGEVLARYQATGSPLLSGYLLGEKFLNDRAAALDVRATAKATSSCSGSARSGAASRSGPSGWCSTLYCR